MSAELHEYFVTSPDYTYTEYIEGLYGGPQYTVNDFEQVQARTKREAVSIAVKTWLAEKRYGDENWSQSQRSDGLCPFTGVRAEVAVCEHGVEMPLGFADDFWCDQCQTQYDAECAPSDPQPESR